MRIGLAALIVVAGVHVGWADDSAKPQFVFERAAGTRVTFKPLQGGEGTATLVFHDPGVALVEVDMPKDLHLDLARTDRREVWFITSGGGFATGYYDRFKQTISPDWKDLFTGLVMDIPASSFRRLDAGNERMTALAIYLPGDIEGIIDQNALPGTAVVEPVAHEKPSAVRYATKVKPYKTKGVELRLVELAAKRKLPAAKKARELIYVLAGSATAQLDGQTVSINGTNVLHVPAGIQRTITATTKLRALQILVPQP